MLYFKTWLFSQFPEYIQSSDTLKNVDGEGLWQRYLSSMGSELDENFIPYLENFLNLVDILKCDDKYLPLIGSILGYPPSIDGVPATYRKLLAFIVAIYKVKGTYQSYEIMFNLLGLKVKVVSDTRAIKVTYDPYPKVTYDQSPTPIKYDSECEYCTNYDIEYKTVGDVPVSIETLGYINNIICFLQPINAKFRILKPVRSRVFDDTFDGTFGNTGSNTSGIFGNTFDNTFN